MKSTRKAHSQGFTLIELLVVIAIIAVLMAIAIPIGMRAFNTGKSAAATAAMRDTILATNAYFDAHGTIEYNFALAADGAGMTSINGKAEPTNAIATDGYSSLIAGVSGKGTATKNRITYLKLKGASLNSEGQAMDGLTRDASNIPHGIVDPWGNRYFIQADVDYSNTITVAADAGAAHAGTTVNLPASKIFMVSAGPDGELGNDDDVTSLR